jgi:hypothetical protein
MDWWRAGTLLAQTLDVMQWTWRLGLVVAGSAALAIAVAIGRQRRLPPPRLGWLLLFALTPFAMAVLVAAPGPRAAAGPTAAWAPRAALFLLAAQGAVACGSIWRAGPWRPLVAGVHALLIWPAICAALVIVGTAW